MLASFVIVLLAIGSTSVSASNYAKYNLLKDDRDAGRLVFPPTTLAQKEVILSNVENALTVWVNYKSKIDHYGPAANPFPTIKKLRKNIKKVTDKGLQLGLTDAFIMARDQHTRWTNMAPCDFYYRTPELRSLFGEDYSKIQAGDELLAIDELSFVEWFEQNQFKSGAGANEFGGQRAALDYLTTIYGKSTACQLKTLSLSSSNPELTPEQLYCQCPVCLWTR
ncbi:hypothetical protein BASA50_006445 [Batrachochytrium salamandrivorans]|uniref:Uncharacterized protein n=1 Tax=Batrachochytrium salamandrivorans TaxID=1357716 RepID=A0ABQ8FAN3_9FUNG|nr:hypothetical protein BASA50_006445 [Batrachochytrium salamandrivorans]